MAQRLKRWESPRREGRNDKGRGGSARQRQKRKQFQALRQKLKDQSADSEKKQPKHPGGSEMLPLFFWLLACSSHLPYLQSRERS